MRPSRRQQTTRTGRNRFIVRYSHCLLELSILSAQLNLKLSSLLPIIGHGQFSVHIASKIGYVYTQEIPWSKRYAHTVCQRQTSDPPSLLGFSSPLYVLLRYYLQLNALILKNVCIFYLLMQPSSTTNRSQSMHNRRVSVAWF